MRFIFVLAIFATLFALTTAYYPGGNPPQGDLLGARRGGDLVDYDYDYDDVQRLKVKGFLKEVARKVIIPKVVDKLQALEETPEDVELQKLKINKVFKRYVLPKVIAALDESIEEEDVIDLYEDEMYQPRKRPSRFLTGRFRGIRPN